MHLLIGLHAGLGELGAMAFLWVYIEMLAATPSRIKRAKLAALLGLVFIFASWIIGGYYYVGSYGSLVKPLIKEGPSSWSHGIIMETKEHIFLFLPVLSMLVYGFINKYENELETNVKARRAVLIFALSVAVIALLMAGFGFLISSGFRSALEIKLL